MSESLACEEAVLATRRIARNIRLNFTIQVCKVRYVSRSKSMHAGRGEDEENRAQNEESSRCMHIVSMMMVSR